MFSFASLFVNCACPYLETTVLTRWTLVVLEKLMSLRCSWSPWMDTTVITDVKLLWSGQLGVRSTAVLRGSTGSSNPVQLALIMQLPAHVWLQKGLQKDAFTFHIINHKSDYSQHCINLNCLFDHRNIVWFSCSNMWASHTHVTLDMILSSLKYVLVQWKKQGRKKQEML